jgi:nucleoside-diphosphate-sugar epimerase
MLTKPETLDTSWTIRMKLDDPPNPDSYYAVSKLFGENLGKLYSEQHGVEFVGLRIGWLTARDDPAALRGTPSEDYMRAMFLSHRDCVEAHRRALEVDARFLLAYVISDNDRRVFDLEETARLLGFVPQDNAEDCFAH